MRAFLPSSEVPVDPFLRAVRCPSGRIDVLDAALAIVLDARPDADLEPVRRTLDEWGARVSRRIRAAGAESEPLTGALILNKLLFEEEGFSGDNYWPAEMEPQTYYEPVERGFERQVKERIAYWNKLRLERGDE